MLTIIVSGNAAPVYWRPPNIYHDHDPQPTREQYSERPTADPRQTLSTELQTQASGQLHLRLAPVMHGHQELPLVPDEVGVTTTSPAITGERAAEPPTLPCNAWKPRVAPGFRRCESYPYIDCNAWRAGSCTSDFNLQCKEAKSLPLAPDDVGVTPTSPATHTCRPTQST
jgi:hypothetical protein